MTRSKKYREFVKKIDKEKAYSAAEAIKLILENRTAKFDETVEVHMRLGVDPRQADQQLRGTVSLPHGTGRDMKVVVFAQGDKAKEAEEAGAYMVGGEELGQKVQKGFTDFDVTVATPDMMQVVGKLGRVLGPRGLMPNPKAGTVTSDVGDVVRDLKKGKIEYRTDKYAIIHVIIGNTSFDEKALIENYSIVYDEIMRAKPAKAKGRYIESVFMAPTMGPGLKIDHVKSADLLKETA